MNDHAAYLDHLRARGLLPTGCRSAFIVGSVARGWDNAVSDLDICLVSDEPWRSGTNGFEPMPLEPAEIATEVTHVDGRRWELKYWLDGQVGQVIDKVSWSRFEDGTPSGQLLTTWEEEFLERLLTCRPLAGEDWVLQQRARIEASAFRAFVLTDCLSNSDDCLEDLVGQLASGDLHSAVLSARLAFGHVVDTVLAAHGEFGRSPKWRSRRIREVDPPSLPFDRYWAVETMRTFDPEDPRRWVEEVAGLCKALSMEVEI